MRARRKNRGQAGFTMAEAMIATAILGMIGALVAGTFSRAMDARDRAEQITSHYHQVRQAMLRMSREIQMAFISEHRKCDEPRSKTLFVGKQATDGMRLDFTSFSHFKTRADANESDQNELSYFITTHPDPGPDVPRGTKVLIRREQSRIDDEPDEGGVEQVLAEGIEQLDFEFYNAKEDRWEDEWDTTDSDYKGRLPMFVKIMMKVKGLDGKDEEFITKTRVFLGKSIQITGIGFAKCID